MFETRDSTIAGKGNFSTRHIKANTNLGVGLERIGSSGNADKDFVRHAICTYTNHSAKPNLHISKKGNRYMFLASRDIEPGEELTVDYNAFDFDGKRDFAKTAAELGDLWKHYEEASDQSHGVNHIKCVLTNAQQIAKNYKELNPDDVELAALLHDIGREDELNGFGPHTERGVELSRDYIAHLGSDRQHAIMDAIRNHMSSGIPTTTMGRIISDADRLCSVPTIPTRSYNYFTSRGLEPNASLRRSYWSIRHKKLKTLENRSNNFHTPEGKELFHQQVKDLEARTRTFKDYLKCIQGVDRSMEFKPKTAAAITGYHYSKDGKHPDNILNFSEDRQKEILKSMAADGFKRGKDYIPVREFMERYLKRVAEEKAGNNIVVSHPLYFRIGKDPMGWSKDYNEYKIDDALLRKATYTIGDSFDYLRMYRRNKYKKSLPNVLRNNLLTYKELKSMDPKELKEHPNLADGRGGNYVEGQVWVPYKVDGNTIVEDKEMSEQLQKKARFFTYDDLRDAGRRINAGAPAGSVTPEPKGQAAVPVTTELVPGAEPGKAVDMVQGKPVDLIRTRDYGEKLKRLLARRGETEVGKVASNSDVLYDKLKADLKGEHEAINLYQKHIDTIPNGKVKEKLVEIRDEEKVHAKELNELLAKKASEFEGRMENFRTSYKLPSGDPMDQLKIKGYRETNEKLLKRYKWQPAIQEHLEKEMEYADGKTEQAKAQEEMSLKQQDLMLKSQEIGLKMQEKGVGQQESLVRAQVKMMEGQAHHSKKEGDALVISAGKGVALPSTAQPAGMPSLGVPTGPANVNQEDPNTQQQQADPQQQGQQGQPTQSQSAGDSQQQQVNQEQGQGQKAPKGKVKKAGMEQVAKKMGAGVRQFAKNVGGRQSELDKLNTEFGYHKGLYEANEHNHLVREVNEAMMGSTKDQIGKIQGEVRKARTDAAIGTGIGAMLYNEYSQPKYASDYTTLVLNRTGGYAADVMHAVSTLPNGIQTDAKKKLIASAAMAGVAAGMAAYGATKIPTALKPYMVNDKAGLELGKAIGKMLPLLGTAGGSYYAWRNKENDRKRMIGSAVAALSGAGLATQVLDRTPVEDVTKEMVMKAMPFSVGSTTMFGSIMYGAHPAQSIADQEVVDNAMSSEAPLHEVAEIVNNIREQRNLNSRYPVTRYLPIPGVAKKLINANYGKPAGTMNGVDMAHYFQTQVDKEYQSLLRRYEANNGRASQEAMTELKSMAHDTVTARLME